MRIAVAEDPATAEVWRDALEQAGIRSLVRDVDTPAAWSGGAGLTFEVLVLEGDADAARAIVGAEPDAPPPEPRHQHRWPRLGRRRRHGPSETP